MRGSKGRQGQEGDIVLLDAFGAGLVWGACVIRMVGYLFAGQGSQYVGMGKDLYDAFPESKAVFDKADKVLGFSLSKLCFEGPLRRVNQDQ